MRAIILAAGRGSRMGQLTDDKPKCMVEVCKSPLIHQQISALQEAGITEIAVVTGYLRDKIHPQPEVQFYNNEWHDTNMVASLYCAKDWLSESDCIISYSDIFYESSAVTTLLNCAAGIAITYDPYWRELWQQRFDNPLEDAETFKFDAAGILTEIGKKTKNFDDVQGQYMGLLKLSSSSWQDVSKFLEQCSEQAFKKMDMTTLLNHLITSRGYDICALPYEGRWGEVDSITDKALYDRLYV